LQCGDQASFIATGGFDGDAIDVTLLADGGELPLAPGVVVEALGVSR
jgi:hypothetical protein